MKEVVASVEEALRQEGVGQVVNAMRTRSRGPESVLNVMHANLSYLGRGGLKAYMSSKAGTRFVLVLFDGASSTVLAVMGADIIGRFRTGAASGVATRHLYGRRSGNFAVLGSGRQALTQVLAVAEVMSLEEVRVWSPTSEHREAFAARLSAMGHRARACDSAAKAVEDVQVLSTMTSSKEPLLSAAMLRSVSHANVCGGNVPEYFEIAPSAVRMFDTIVVDDIPQAKVEYGDLIQAAEKRIFTWDSVVTLGSIVAGKQKGKGKTLFRSGGVALEDVAVASMLYDKAVKSGNRYPDIELV